MPKLLLMLFILFYWHPIFSQEYFLKVDKLKKKEIQKSKTYHEGHWVHIKTIDDKKLKGNFIVIDDKTISVNGHQIALSDIYKIRFNNGHLFSGISLTAIGGITLSIGSLAAGLEDIFGEDTNNNAENAQFLGFAAMTAGIFVLVKKGKRPRKKNWQISIVKNE